MQWGRYDPLVSEHPPYHALGGTVSERQLAYRRLFDMPAAPDEVDAIRIKAQRQHPLWSNRFKDAIERQLARRVGSAKVGRP